MKHPAQKAANPISRRQFVATSALASSFLFLPRHLVAASGEKPPSEKLNIATRVDSRIEWDAANMKVTNLPDANKYVRAEYRKGWTL